MNYILIEDEICLATHFTVDKEKDIKPINSARTLKQDSVITSTDISGEMKVFKDGQLTDFFNDYGQPSFISVEIVLDGLLYSLEKVLLTKHKELSPYDYADGVYCEYIADDMTVEEPPDLSNTVSI